MLLREDQITEAIESQRQRSVAFGAKAAKRIRAAGHCRFSLLPHEDLARLASGWYDASARTMLNGNYVPIDTWIQTQARLAAEQNFAPEDVLELLRICRSEAIQREKWSEEIFSAVDDAINDALKSVACEVGWTLPATLTYISASTANSVPLRGAEPRAAGTADLDAPEKSLKSWPESWSDDRRGFGRNSLKLPIRVRAAESGYIDELTYSENVSRGGLYFLTRSSSYRLQMALKVTYPYWSESGAINREYGAKVVRMDRMTDGSFGVAVKFTESLGPRPRD